LIDGVEVAVGVGVEVPVGVGLIVIVGEGVIAVGETVGVGGRFISIEVGFW